MRTGCMHHSRYAIVALLGFTVQAQGEGTHLRFEIFLPPEPVGQRLIWGVRRDGLEAGRGSYTIAPDQAGGRPLSFEAVTDRSLIEPARVQVFLNLNQDRWESYVPSFGDLFQLGEIQADGSVWKVRAAADRWKKVLPTRPDAVLTVHYRRFDGAYGNVSLWTWDEHLRRAPQPNELLPVGQDDYGAVFQIDTAAYGSPGDRIGLLPRLNFDWSFKDGPDRFWSPSMPLEVYILEGMEEVCTEPPDARPRIMVALLDAEDRLTVRFNLPVAPAQVTAEGCEVHLAGRPPVCAMNVEPVRPVRGAARIFTILLEDAVDPSKLSTARVRIGDLGEVRVQPGQILFDRRRFYDADARLGAEYDKSRTTFRVFAPTAEKVELLIADAAAGHQGLRLYAMTAGRKGIWEKTVEGDLAGRFYAYRLTGPGLDPDREVVDIYATCTQADASRSMIVDLRATDPPGFRQSGIRRPASPVDAVICEMHVRDFTIAASSGAEPRGTYAAIARTGTHLPGHPEIATGLDHLKQMGITHVQLMPVQDFDNRNEENDIEYNWGYMPVHFNSPDGWLATSARGDTRIRELKQAIQALHAAGIGVILDVVYNHTSALASFDKLVPSYYYRLDENGQFANGSGCGNEFRSEAPMARKFIIDSLRFWVEEYRVDGFRFDLMALIDIETMKEIRRELSAIDPGILVYGEPWTGGPSPLRRQADKSRVRGTGIAAFNDDFRDAIKGDRDGGPPGFIQAGDRLERIRQGLLGVAPEWPLAPTDTINYFECHDNLTAWDKIVQTTPGADDALRARMMRFGALILFTAQGIPFYQIGQEFCRTKQGHHNSYNQPDKINQVDWSRKLRFAGVCDYFRGMIAFRREHPLLRLRTAEEVEKRITFPPAPTERSIVCRLAGRGLEGESAAWMLLLLNGESQETTFSLPRGEWMIHADADRADVRPIGRASQKVTLPPHSGMLLVR